MKELELQRSVLLSFQRALLDMIYPAIRGITVGYKGGEKLSVICYLDREPNEDDIENIAVVTTEVCADIPSFKDVEELCIFSNEPYRELKTLDRWVYFRQETKY